MGKFRTKLKGATKGKRWLKGQSSNSNPETRKFRNSAKSQFFHFDTGKSNLTSEALRKHDAIQNLVPENSKMENTDSTIEEDIDKSTYNTFKTFASDWSNCSNMSYKRFLSVFRSDSALHKEMLAILAAITEVIKENGGSETPVEYYCSLITTLEQIVNTESINEEQVTAVLSLLNMGIKSVPEGVLKSGFSKVSDRMLQILSLYSSSDNNIIMKSVFGILSAFLKCLDSGEWSDSSTQQVFCAILNPFSIHTKPKWRKAAQQAIFTVVSTNYFVDKDMGNPVADKVAEFCETSLDNYISGNSDTVVVSTVKAGQTTILHILGLMKDTIRYFSKQHVKKCSEIILRLIHLNSPLLTSCSLQVFHSLFSIQKATIPSKLIAKLISAIYECMPSRTDVRPMIAWIAVMQQAHIYLADVDMDTFCSTLPKVFGTLIDLWSSEKPEVTTAATHSLEAILQDAVAPICENPSMVKKNEVVLMECFKKVDSGLGYQYTRSWPQVLRIISIVFQVAGENCHGMLINTLKILSERRDSLTFTYNNELEHAIGAAIRSMGPEVVLHTVTLMNDNGSLNTERCWLLPVLKENIKTSTLEFWTKNILPLAYDCEKKSKHLTLKGDSINAHSMELLYLQLWNLLPSFCTNPTDVTITFKGVAKFLGESLTNRKELRLAIMMSLRKLINHAKESSTTDSELNEIAKFDKNYLNILFNLYLIKPNGSDEEGHRLATLDTIKVFLSITREEVISSLFNNVLNKIKDEQDAFTKESLMDLLRALIPYQNLENINLLFEMCIKNLSKIKDKKEQKKTYRLLEEICGSEREECKKFVTNNRKYIQKLLMKSLNSDAVCSKGARLRCLHYLVKTQPQLNGESKFLKSILSETIMCCKDVNEKCRSMAYRLLILIGETLQEHNQMKQFVNMLISGLGGTQHLISCTLLALTSVLYNFTQSLGQETINFILENVCVIMTSPNREIVAPSLGFLKVYCRSLPSPNVGMTLPKIMESLCGMSDDCKRHFRLKVRDILDKLVKRFGCEALTPHIPTNDTIMYKRLKNIRKQMERKKRQRESVKEGEAEEEDEFLVKAKPKSIDDILAESDSDDEIVENNQARSVKKNKLKTWITENSEDIVDLFDPTAMSKISITEPKTSKQQVTKVKQKKKDGGFKTAPDGRLIIQDDLSDSDSEQNVSTISDSESDAGLSVTNKSVQTIRKRKRSETSSLKSEKTSNIQSNKYKSGGTGIHRPINSASSTHEGSNYRCKKARGDMKKKGKLDPYVYLPLARSTLNKRKKMKNVGKFRHIIGSPKNGFKKGVKSKKSKNV